MSTNHRSVFHFPQNISNLITNQITHFLRFTKKYQIDIYNIRNIHPVDYVTIYKSCGHLSIRV